MRALLVSLAISAALYLVIVALAYGFQRNLLYFPDQTVLTEKQIADAGFDPVKITSEGAGELSSLWRAPIDKTKPVIIHFHGNAGSLAMRLSIYRAMAQDGAGVLAVGYPGYGGNPGSPSEQTFYTAAQAHYDWLIAEGYGDCYCCPVSRDRRGNLAGIPQSSVRADFGSGLYWDG